MAVYPTPGRSFARPPSTKTRLYLEQRYPLPGKRAVSLRLLLRSILATCLTAELGFFGDIVVTLVTIPFACGHFFNIGVLENVGLLYLRLTLRKGRFLRVDCKLVAIFKKTFMLSPRFKLLRLVTKYRVST